MPTILRKHVRRSAVAGRELFVDTSAWFPLLLRNHEQHDVLAAALRSAIAGGERVVTTNLVLAETYTLLLYRGHRSAGLTFLRTIRERPNVIVSSTQELEERAVVDWLERFDDQKFSFADAVSFAVMQERGISRALTLDKHFATAGFDMAGAAS